MSKPTTVVNPPPSGTAANGVDHRIEKEVPVPMPLVAVFVGMPTKTLLRRGPSGCPMRSSRPRFQELQGINTKVHLFPVRRVSPVRTEVSKTADFRSFRQWAAGIFHSWWWTIVQAYPSMAGGMQTVDSPPRMSPVHRRRPGSGTITMVHPNVRWPPIRTFGQAVISPTMREASERQATYIATVHSNVITCCAISALS